MREVKALSSLHICTGSPEPSALDNTISTTTPCAGANSDSSDTYADSEYAGESHLHSLSLCNSILSLVHMHNIQPGANIHPGCKFAPGVYFGHVNGAL